MEKEVVVGEDGLQYCKVCGEKLERIFKFPRFDGSMKCDEKKVNCMCRCDLEKKKAHEERMRYEEEQRKIYELQRLSLMDEKLKSVRFSTYLVTSENEKVFGIAKKYVGNFDEMYKRSQGILFWGDVGTGKSYTAAVIANELIQKQIPVIMTSFIKLLQELGNFESDDGDYIKKLNVAKLLIIDDFGAERGTDFALEKVYNIIDSRYRSGKPIILTSNIGWDEMKRCSDIRYNRIYDRVFEMCYPVKVEGRSWRKKEAVSRYEEMKKILEG